MRDPSNNENTSISDSKTVGKHHAMEALDFPLCYAWNFPKKLSWQSSSSSSSLTFPTRRCWTECVPMANLFCYLPKSRAGQLPLFDGSPSPISIDVSMGFQSYTFTYEMFHGIYMCIYNTVYMHIYYIYYVYHMLSYHNSDICNYTLYDVQ